MLHKKKKVQRIGGVWKLGSRFIASVLMRLRTLAVTHRSISQNFFYIRAELVVSRIPGTIAHELRHLGQSVRLRLRDEAENDASEYEREALTRFLNRK